MLLDSNLILMDSSPVLGAAVTGPAVGLTSFLHPGSMEPVPVCAKVVGEDFAGGTILLSASLIPIMRTSHGKSSPVQRLRFIRHWCRFHLISQKR